MVGLAKDEYATDALIEITQALRSLARFERSMEWQQGAVGSRGKTCMRATCRAGRVRGIPLSCSGCGFLCKSTTIIKPEWQETALKQG